MLKIIAYVLQKVLIRDRSRRKGLPCVLLFFDSPSLKVLYQSFPINKRNWIAWKFEHWIDMPSSDTKVHLDFKKCSAVLFGSSPQVWPAERNKCEIFLETYLHNVEFYLICFHYHCVLTFLLRIPNSHYVLVDMFKQCILGHCCSHSSTSLSCICINIFDCNTSIQRVNFRTKKAYAHHNAPKKAIFLYKEPLNIT